MSNGIAYIVKKRSHTEQEPLIETRSPKRAYEVAEEFIKENPTETACVYTKLAPMLTGRMWKDKSTGEIRTDFIDSY